MKAEQVEKIFKLIEPFLPKQTAVDFKQFLAEFYEQQVLSDYNLIVIERQHQTIDQFSQKARLQQEKIKELETKLASLSEESESHEMALYNEQKKQFMLAEETMVLQKKISELNALLQNEIEKNYQFAESVMKMAEDNRTMLANNKKLNEDYQALLSNMKILTDDHELLEEQYNTLMSVHELLHGKIQQEYGRGFQEAHFRHRKKR